MESGLETLSLWLGWAYFVAWSASFYPQVLLNYNRKSVRGLSFDFLALNLYGFICYSIFNGTFYFSKSIQDEYIKKWGKPNVVQLNDVFFGIHAVLITLITIYQASVYDKSPHQRISQWAKHFILFTSYGTLVLFLNMYIGSTIALDVVYYFSYVKMSITLIKYVPQAYLNFKRQSTLGWSIGNILLDFTGGILSIAQLFLDSIRNGDWTGVTGNPVKFGLGLVSILFDLLFMFQHYVLYAGSEIDCVEEEVLRRNEV